MSKFWLKQAATHFAWAFDRRRHFRYEMTVARICLMRAFRQPSD